MTIEEAYSFVKNEKTNVSRPGLERIHKLMERLGNPEKTMKMIHIVGTNGKGSVTAMLSGVLCASGHRVFLMSSPALYGLKDYYKLNNREIPDESYCNAVEQVQKVCATFPEEELPTEFEMSVAVGVLIAAEAKCDFLLLEAGMGGSKDATHLETPAVMTVITHIALDHMKYLGTEVTEIAKEKIGIAAEGEPIVLGRNEKEVYRTCSLYAFSHGNPFVYANHPGITPDFDALGVRLQLPGLFQKENAKTVCAAVYALRMLGYPVPDIAVKKGLESVKLPFRCQIRRMNPYFIMDGGHNPDCIRALTDTLGQLPDSPKFTIVTGVMADKAYAEMYAMLLPYAERFITVTPDNPRSMPAKELKKFLQALGAEAVAVKSLHDAAEHCADAYRNGANILCTGTLYMMSDLEYELHACGLMI